MGHPERESHFHRLEEGDCIGRRLGIIDGQMDEPGAPIDGDIEVALADFTVRRSQLWQMLHIDVDKTQVVIVEFPVATRGNSSLPRWSAVKPGVLQNAPDAVTVKMRQEVLHHKSEVIEAELGGAAEMADDGPFFLGRLPCQLPGTARAIKARIHASSAPFAHCFIADPVTAGQCARGL
jgi:hypothetical protein